MSLPITVSSVRALNRAHENIRRSNRAARALRAFRGKEVMDEADFRDLLANLMHYARRHAYDFETELAKARRNFEEEI